MTDLRQVFAAIGKGLEADFERSQTIGHRGGKGSVRESDLRTVLETHLPKRFSVGSGEIASPDNRVSRQTDVVFYDSASYPPIFSHESHTIFPIESVFGTLEVKSVLSKGELDDAFEKVGSLKRLRPSGTFVHTSNSAASVSLPYPSPYCGVFAYKSGRSIATIKEQVKTLMRETTTEHTPDFVAILGEGIFYPTELRRGPLNAVAARRDPYETVCTFFPAKRFTVLRMYLALFQGLNSLILPPLRLNDYLYPPQWIDGAKVERGVFHIGSLTGLYTFSSGGIRKILDYCSATELVSNTELLRMTIAGVSEALLPAEMSHPSTYVYNPRALRPATVEEATRRAWERETREEQQSEWFSPLHVTIDGQHYAVDIGSLDIETDLTRIQDMDTEEFIGAFFL